jgi:YVTN family beta-propeller protein
MTHLHRSRKSFTLLELMVAFIIMAVLSAVAIPSLINVVGNDQLSADSASAAAIVDAAYLTAQSEIGEASPSVTFPITAAEASEFIPAGTSAAVVSIVDDAAYGDPVPAITFTFTDGDIIYVAAPQSDTDPSPTTLGGTSPDGGVIGGGADGLGGGAVTTTSTTTTTVPPVYDDIATCSISVTGTLPATNDALGGTSNASNAYSLSCTGVTGPQVDATFAANGSYFNVQVNSYDAYENNTGAPYASLPASFTATYPGDGPSWADGTSFEVNPITSLGTSAPSYDPPAGDVGLSDDTYSQLSCYTAGCGTIDSSSVTADAPYPLITVGNEPLGISSDGVHVWVANATDNTVTELNASDGSFVRTIPAGTAAYGISSDGTHVWVANQGDGTVTEIDAATGAVVGSPTPAGLTPTGISSDGTHVWVTDYDGGTVTEIDAATGAVVGSPISVSGNPIGISSDGVHVWVGTGTNTITELDATDGSFVRNITVGLYPGSVSSDGTHVWAVNVGDNTVTEIDAATGAVVGSPIPIPVSSAGSFISSDGTHVWVATYNYSDPSNNIGTVTEIDASTATVVASYNIGFYTEGISADGTHVWIANSAGSSVSEITP